MAYTQIKDGRWIVYYRAPGKHGKSQVKKEYFGRGPEAQAAAKARNDELDLRVTRPARKKPAAGPLFFELAEEYVQNKHFSENSKKQLKIRLNANILPALGTLPALRITDKDLDDYVKSRRACTVRRLANISDRRLDPRGKTDGNKTKPVKYTYEPVKFSTIRRELTDIKSILNWAAGRRPKLIPYNPVAGYQKPAEDTQTFQPPTLEETRAILAVASDHLKRFIKLSFYLGARPGATEILGITWERVSFENNTILIESAHKGGPEWRAVPIHPDILEDLAEWREADLGVGYVVNYRGRRVKSIRSAWWTALKSAGISRNIRPYDLRHHFVTAAIAAGADIKSVADVVGSSPKTIMKHYQHVSSEQHRSVVAKQPSLKQSDHTEYDQKTRKGQL